MPKAEKGTPKYLANKMKAKGLQKLRWYCQMCQKQCRDENGFKCHTTSESHQRQLLLFGENPYRYLDEFSKEFSDGYVELLRRRFGTRRVAANQVYQEYIADRNHLHMNATKWLSLTGFVQWLGREGKCIVEENEKGWFVTYIDRDPETIARQQALAKKDKMDKDDEERTLQFVEKQVERLKEKAETSGPSFTELNRVDDAQKIVFSLKDGPKEEKPKLASKILAGSSSFKPKLSKLPEKRKSALDEIREEEERRKQRKFHNNSWLFEDIVVKITTRAFGERYCGEKGVIVQVRSQFMAIVKLLENGDKLQVNQNDLETVVPGEGRKVLIVNGQYRGNSGKLVKIRLDSSSADIKIRKGEHAGVTVERIPFDHLSKLHEN